MTTAMMSFLSLIMMKKKMQMMVKVTLWKTKLVLDGSLGMKGGKIKSLCLILCQGYL